MTVVQAILETLDFVERAGIEYMVGGSFASGAWGHPRQTNDMDLVVHIGPDSADRLLAMCADAYYIEPGDVRAALESKEAYAAFQMLHIAASFKFDLFVLGKDAFAQSEFGRRTLAELWPNVRVPTATPEDIVLRKLHWYQVGNFASERQWRDVVQVIETAAIELDNDYLNKWAAHLGVSDLLQEALAEVIQSTPDTLQHQANHQLPHPHEP